MAGMNKEERRKRIVWTEEEEQQLERGLRKHGESNWNKIKNDPEFPALHNRSNIDIKDKWRNMRKRNSAAGEGVVLEKWKMWTPEEDAVLVAAVRKHGSRWVEILKTTPCFSNRTSNAIQSRYNRICKIKAVTDSCKGQTCATVDAELTDVLSLLSDMEDVKIVILGSHGTSSILALIAEQFGTHTYTNTSKGLKYNNVEFVVCGDVKDQEIRCFFSNTIGIIFVVDKDHITAAQQLLFEILNEDELKDAVLLVLVTNSGVNDDGAEETLIDEITDKLIRPFVNDRRWIIRALTVTDVGVCLLRILEDLTSQVVAKGILGF